MNQRFNFLNSSLFIPSHNQYKVWWACLPVTKGVKHETSNPNQKENQTILSLLCEL